MSLPLSSGTVAHPFAEAVVNEDWDTMFSLLSAVAQSKYPAPKLAKHFRWKQLDARLRREWIEESGESAEMVPELDPPARFEIFEHEHPEPPVDHDPAIPFGWMKIEFFPDEDSEFDLCYNCLLAFVNVSASAGTVSIRRRPTRRRN